MGSDFQTHGTPRARAVADAPVETLLGRTDELARRWAIALIVALPLERIGDIPLDGFAREAPSLFAQVVRALQSDSDLEHLIAPPPNGAARHGRGGEDARAPQAHRLGALTGARDGTAAVQAVEALRGVVWEALLGELRWPSPEAAAARQMADLADRLAHVCSSVLVAALESVSTAIGSGAPARSAHQAAAVTFAAHHPPAYEEPTIIGGAVIVDEARDPAPRRSRARGTFTRAPSAAAGDADAGAGDRAAARSAAADRSGALPWDFRRPGEDVA